MLWAEGQRREGSSLWGLCAPPSLWQAYKLISLAMRVGSFPLWGVCPHANLLVPPRPLKEDKVDAKLAVTCLYYRLALRRRGQREKGALRFTIKLVLQCESTYPMARQRLRYQSLMSSWSLDMRSSLALGKVNCKRWGETENMKKMNSLYCPIIYCDWCWFILISVKA